MKTNKMFSGLSVCYTKPYTGHSLQRGTEHKYQISRQSDGISKWGTLGGDSPSGEERRGISKKMKKKPLGIHT